MKRVMVLALICVAASSPASAEFDWSKHALINPVNHDDLSNFTGSDRVRFAADISAYCAAGQQTVLPLTPDEQSWMDSVAPNGKLDYADPRAVSVLQNSIYRRNQVIGYYRTCENLAQEAVLTKLMSFRDNVRIWGELASWLFRYSFILSDDVEALERQNMVFGQNMDKGIGVQLHLLLVAKAILEYLPNAQTKN